MLTIYYELLSYTHTHTHTIPYIIHTHINSIIMPLCVYTLGTQSIIKHTHTHTHNTHTCTHTHVHVHV